MPRRNARSVTESIVKYSGCPVYLGTIDFTGTAKTNAEATTPFNAASPALSGKVLLLQATQDCYISAVTTSTGDAASTNSPLIFANERVILTMDDYDERAIAGEVREWLSVVRSTASGNLLVWELT